MKDIALLAQIALRNLFASFLNIIIGGIILVGTLLFVVGGSVLDSMDVAMSRSIVGSIAGNLQVYSDKSKEELALIGNFMFPDIAAMPDFSRVKRALLEVDNVKAVVPMGVNAATVIYGNTVDTVLEKLRNAVRAQQESKGRLDTKEIESLKSHVRQIVNVIRGDYQKLSVIAQSQGGDAQDPENLARAASDAFWSSFDADPYAHLEFLENKIASLVPDADFIALNYAGTDLDAFKASFDRMEIADGQMVPPGKRGLLLPKFLYEHMFKLRIATRLDQIHEALHDEGKTIATDPDLQHMVKQNRTQIRELVLQLDPLSAQKAIQILQTELHSQETELPKLLGTFFDTDDSTFEARYEAFYAHLAPLVQLYRVKPGDTLTIKSFSKTGFMLAANLKVYGTYQFKGLEKSGLAGSLSLMDLMSFRDLYGYVTPDKLEETQQLEAAAGAKMVDRANAEAELFGGSSTVQEAKEHSIDETAELGDGKLRADAEAVANRAYTQAEIDAGVALSAAVILKDPTRLEETTEAIQAAAGRGDLSLRTASWQQAAGMLGQFVTVAKVVLYVAVFIIFIVALAVINNAVMMATLQRIREIGTMRAIGAQRSFVLSMVIFETVMLGLVFGSAGAVGGSAIIKWLGQVGIPARNPFMYFFFSGPRLFPDLSVGNLIGAFTVILFVTCVSALYPAIVATRVSPIQAMQSED
jgi:ABC-type lipoprotein release transport system permease subunit